MSISTLQTNIQRAYNDIASLSKKVSGLTQKLSEKSGKLAKAQDAASRAKSASAQQSKLREVGTLLKEIAKIEKDKADVEKQIGNKKRDLHRYEQQLGKEQERETKKQVNADKQRRKELDEYRKNLDRELAAHRISRPIVSPQTLPDDPVTRSDVKKHDLFISHASEDKDDFVRPLAMCLHDLGLDVWFDETSLKLGDSLRQSIDKGLANSRFGVVVLSTAFFAKNWPQYELNGLVAREMNGVKVILPIWHKVTKDEVLKYSPTLADKVALNSSMYSVMEIAEKLVEVVRT